MTAIFPLPSFGVSTKQLTIVLIVTSIVFLFFIVIAIIKMYRLKAENKKLLENDIYKSENEEKHEDGHLYQ